MSKEVLFYLNQLRTGARGEDAYQALVELDDSYLPELIEAFYQEQRPKIQALLVEVIWQHRLPETLPFLEKLLRHHHSEVWKTALDGIVAMRHPQGIRILANEKARLQSLNDNSASEQLEWLDEAYGQLQEHLQNGTSLTDAQ